MHPPTPADIAALATVHSAWYPPWLVSLLSQRGRAHYRQGMPTQDAYATGGNDNAFWMVVADGIGSNPLSHYGSRVACQAVAEYCNEATVAGTPPTTDTLRAAFAAAHAAITDRARADNRPLDHYGTTLSAVLIAGDTIVAASVGDSGIVAYTTHDKDGKPTPAITPFCSAPQPPRRNGTYAITNPDWGRAITVRSSTSPHIKALVITTDGGNTFFQTNGAMPESPFNPRFLVAFPHYLKDFTARAFILYFFEYIAKNDADTDDDRTILVAYRPDQDLAPPAAQSR